MSLIWLWAVFLWVLALAQYLALRQVLSGGESGLLNAVFLGFGLGCAWALTCQAVFQ